MSGSSGAESAVPDAREPKPDAEAVLARLREGNARFVGGHLEAAHVDHDRRSLAATADQKDHALATVVTCSDSRVPVESIFDARIMDLFVIRVAGSLIRRAQTASIEYGLMHVHTPLLVILGHTDCGAVKAAIGHTEDEDQTSEDSVSQLLVGILPAVERARAQGPHDTPEELTHRAVEENVWQSIEDLFHSSPVTRRLMIEGRVKVVGAIYDLSTSEVEWLEGHKVDQLLVESRDRMAALLEPWDEDRVEADPSPPRVLLVDDERDFLDSVVERLSFRGVQVDAVDSGSAALDMIDVRRYDTIIMDLQMPGLDGLETLTRALAMNNQLQIVLLTGHATVRLAIEAMKRGALDFIEKPASIDLLVEKIMEGRSRRQELDTAAREQTLREAIERYGW